MKAAIRCYEFIYIQEETLHPGAAAAAVEELPLGGASPHALSGAGC